MSTSSTTIIPVILSGGTGSRLWPLSREAYPKQFWPLVSSETMLAATALRAKGPSFAAPIVVCNEAHRFLAAEQLRELTKDRQARPGAAMAARDGIVGLSVKPE